MMYLLSLPDEMVASVFKFASYSTIKRLKRTNRRADSIAKAFGLGQRLYVSSIAFSSVSLSTTKPWKCTMTLDFDSEGTGETKVVRELEKNHGSHLDIIAMILKKVELRGPLTIVNFCHGIDDQLLEVFEKNSKSLRDMTKFYLSITDVDCSEVSVRKFIGSARKLRDYCISYSRTSMNAFYQIKMLENRRWDAITIGDCSEAGLYRIYNYPRLNDEFLLKVLKNCKRCSIDFSETRCTYFTVDGVIKLIETFTEEEIFPESLDLGNVRLNQISIKEAKNKLCSINNGLQFAFESYEDIYYDGVEREIEKHHCELRSPSNPERVMLEFNLSEEDDYKH